MIELLLLIFFICFFIPYFVNLFFLKHKLNFLDEIINFDKNKNFFSSKTNFGSKLIYVPHHATNWSLNPNHKSKNSNSNSNTIEGFRKVDDFDSIIHSINNSKKKLRIICVGGSTTHCVEMDDYNNTWPSKLNSKLGKDKFQIFNFGVGGWNTMQSITRLLYWSPIIKPNLIIFYQGKNDLTPFANINNSQDFMMPDFQNSIVQYSQSFFFKIPNIFFKIPIFKTFFYLITFRKEFENLGLLNIYKPKYNQDIKGLGRVQTFHLESIFLRISSLFSIARSLNCKIIYIPEIVLEGPYKKILEEKIYPEVKNNIIKKFDNANYFDLSDLLKNDNSNFIDKMHFTEKGNDLFANILKKKILEIFNNE